MLQEHQGEAIGKCVVRINVFRDHRQTIQYILPGDHAKLAQAELVAIDEAAAIPLPVVKRLMGPYLVFLSSTVNGYEGTGRALSLKLIQQLRQQQGAANAAAAAQAGQAVGGAKSKKGERQVHEERWKVAAQAAAGMAGGASGGGVRVLTELTLTTPIRYAPDDPVERWLNQLLCMDVAANAHRIVDSMPAPRDCDLYVVNRDALFSGHALAEGLLQRVWALYTAAHYKNSPNDLQMLSDAPAHRLFVLLGPQKTAAAATAGSSSSSSSSGGSAAVQLPNVLCVLQVAFEGHISQKSVQAEMQKAAKASGDMIPWTLSQQFNDTEFATLSGARVVRIATHPDVQKMGYGSRAMDLLINYFQGRVADGPPLSLGQFGGEGAAGVQTLRSTSTAAAATPLTGDLHADEVAPRVKLPPLLTALADRPPERLHWMGVSYGLTAQLLNFWSRKQFKVVYLRQTKNDLTGEHSCIMLRELNSDGDGEDEDGPIRGWLGAYVADYRKRLVALMSYAFSSLEAAVAIPLVDPDRELTSASADNDTDTAAAPSSSSSSSSSSSAVATDATTLLVRAGSGTATSHMPALTATELLSVHLSHHDMKRLELYSRNMVDHHMIVDTLHTLARLLFLGRLRGVRLSYLQVAILLATGLQHRDVDSVAAELDVPVNQVLAFFNKTIRKISQHLRELVERHVAAEMPSGKTLNRMEKKAAAMGALAETLAEDQRTDEKAFAQAQAQRALLMGSRDLAQHAMSEDRVGDGALQTSFLTAMKKQKTVPSSISVPVAAAAAPPNGGAHDGGDKKKKAKKNKQRRDEDGGGGGGKKRKIGGDDS